MRQKLPHENSTIPTQFDRRGKCSRHCEWSSKVHGNLCPQGGCGSDALPQNPDDEVINDYDSFYGIMSGGGGPW